MTARSIRREAERKANKLARKAAAHRANAQSDEPALLSEAKTQPVDEPAVLTGAKIQTVTALTGRAVLLPTDDAAEYQRRLRAYEKELAPVGQLESDLAQSIVDTMWRLKRIPALEMAIFAQGYVQFADQFKEHDESLRSGMIELQTFLTYERQLRNLQFQESRLSRRREKETAELRKLQSERKAKEAEAPVHAATSEPLVKSNDTSFKPAPNGFEFSTAAPSRPITQESLSESAAQAA